MMELASELLGTLLGGMIAVLSGLHLYKLQRREQITQKYIDEFLSETMLRHRIVAARLRERIREKSGAAGSVGEPFSIELLARGFWNGGADEDYTYYKGPTDPHTGLNEHQSLEAILQYISRLIMNLERGNIDLADFKSAVRGSFIWLDDLLLPLEMEIKRQTDQRKREGKLATATDRINRLHKLRSELQLQKPD